MWNYKNCFYLTLGLVLLLAVCLVGDALGIGYPRAITYAIWFIVIVGECLLLYSLVVLLKASGESKWRIFPFYLFMGAKIITTISDMLPRSSSTIEAANRAMFVGLVVGTVSIYLIINIFLIKNKTIRVYFRAYAYAIITLFLYGVLGMWLLAEIETRYDFYRTNIYIRSVLAMMPSVAVLVMYWKLYDKNFRFKPGDLVVIKRDSENVVSGSKGVVAAKHQQSGYYEVEFFDENEALLNTLTVAGKDLEHAPEPDLQARVETFGI